MYTIERLKRDHPIVILPFSYSLHVSPFLSQGCDFLFNTCLNVNLKLIQLVELKTIFFFTINNSVWILFHFFSLRVWKKKEQNKNGLLTVLRKSDRSQTPLNRRSNCKENCLSSILVLFIFWFNYITFKKYYELVILRNSTDLLCDISLEPFCSLNVTLFCLNMIRFLTVFSQLSLTCQPPCQGSFSFSRQDSRITKNDIFPRIDH